MAVNIFANITKKGTEAAFHQAMDAIPTVWDKHCMQIPSTAASEEYVWPGFLPEPRRFLSGRTLVGIRDFTYTQENYTYELSFLIDRNSVADDQHGLINARIQEAAEVWATYKDSLFATLLINGESATLGIDTLDGSAFHLATRTIGGSGTINNTQTANISDADAPSSSQILTALKTSIQKMMRYNDDTGRPFNMAAANEKRLLYPPEYDRAVKEAIQSTIISSSSNPWGQNLVEPDMLVYLTDADNSLYLSFCGAVRMPFIFQSREPLEIVVYNEQKEVAKENGVLVLCRERFRMGYGDPRRNLRYDFT